MTVRRIVANIAAADPERARAFYSDLLNLEVAMDLGWILTFASDETARAQVSVASEGGSGTPVPNLSIEVVPDAPMAHTLTPTAAKTSLKPRPNCCCRPAGCRPPSN